MRTVQTERTPAPPAHPAVQPELSVAAAARRLGVAPATLRTWDRRYGIGPSEHTPGQHRRYAPDDVARLELMQQALVRGASPADAARYATTVALPGPEPTAPIPILVPAAGGDDRPFVGSHIRLGGMVLRLPGCGRRAHGLARAAMMLDPVPVRGLLTESVATVGVESTWDEVVRPVLNAISDRWRHTGTGVEVEHLLTECVTVVFAQCAANGPVAVEARPVLLAGMPGEQHVLPMVALSAVLAGRGVPCRMLGANLPVPALVAAVRRTAPSVVVLWAHLAAAADVEALRVLPRTRPRFRIYAAGPGWADTALPPRVGWLDSMVAARREIADVVTV